MTVGRFVNLFQCLVFIVYMLCHSSIEQLKYVCLFVYRMWQLSQIIQSGCTPDTLTGYTYSSGKVVNMSEINLCYKFITVQLKINDIIHREDI